MPPLPAGPSVGYASGVSVLHQIGNTPMVPLRHLTPAGSAPVWVKCEHLNPGGSVKDRIAKAILDDARAHGRLPDGATLVEATAGNTGIGLALCAAAWGYSLACVMPEKMSVDKRVALAAVGAEVIITPNAPPGHDDNFQEVAARLARDRGWFLTDQFRNPANVWAHEHGTGPEILQQCEGSIAAFVAGAGTGGTITGVGRALRAAGSDAEVVLADPEGSGLAQWVSSGELGPDGAYAVEGIGGSAVPEIMDRAVIDRAVTVSDADSFATARALIRDEGLLVGGSAGTAVAAALKVAAGRGGDDPVVAVLPDGWDRYLSCDWLRRGTQPHSMV